MDFTHANCAKVMEELAKARLKMSPYDTTGGWRDPNTWSILMLALVGSDCPKTRDGVFEIIFTFENLFKQEGRFNITDDELLRNMYIVFGPGEHGDPGSLRTSDLSPLLLPVRKVDSDAVPLAILEYDGDGDGAGECVVQHGAGTCNSPPKQKNCKRPKTTFTAEQKSDMVVLYRKSTEHLSAIDAGIFLHHVSPGSVAFQSLALLPFAERKATITAAVKEYKTGRYERRFPPSYLSHHHQQGNHHFTTYPFRQGNELDQLFYYKSPSALATHIQIINQSTNQPSTSGSMGRGHQSRSPLATAEPAQHTSY